MLKQDRPQGNVVLINYGIQNENSDIRAHVSMIDKAIYVFKTVEGLRAIEKYNPPLRFGFQSDVTGPTSEGWLVKPEWIKDIRKIKYPSWSGWDFYDDSMSTSEKGKLAMGCVINLLKIGRFPLWIDARENECEDIQINGIDIVVTCNKKIQVKWDYKLGITGNLFLQKSERNPLGLT